VDLDLDVGSHLKIYEDSKLFWNEISPHLKAEEAKNSLCLGLSYIFQSDPSARLYQAALFGEEGFLGAVVGSSYLTNRNLLPSPVKSGDHAKQLFEAVKTAGIEITGVVAEAATANFYRELFQKSGRQTKTHMTQGIYRCSKTRMPEIPKGLKFRRAQVSDIEKIGGWIESFHHEAVPHDPPIKGQDVAEAKINKNMIYVIEKDGGLLSMAAWSRDIETSCSVNMVFTPKSSRKNGYASIVTGMLTQHLLNSGKKETNLYTDMSNPTSNKIYQDLGYEFVCNSVHFGVL
jgi:hypothetical protein